MAARPPAFDRLSGEGMHKRDERFERVTRALLDEEDPQDAAGAQAWLNNWKYFLELSYSRRVEAANRHRALQEAVTAGKVSRDMVPYALHMKLPKGNKCTDEVLLCFGQNEGLQRWADVLELVDTVKNDLAPKAAALRKALAAERAAAPVQRSEQPRGRKRKASSCSGRKRISAESKTQLQSLLEDLSDKA